MTGLVQTSSGETRPRCSSPLIVIFKPVSFFYYTAVAGIGKVLPVNQVNHTSWVAVVTPTDCPKSVRNCCVIDLFFFWRCLCCHFALLTFLLV